MKALYWSLGYFVALITFKGPSALCVDKNWLFTNESFKLSEVLNVASSLMLLGRAASVANTDCQIEFGA